MAKNIKKKTIFNLTSILRIIIILYIILISSLALDAESAIGLLIHLIPFFILTATLALTWKNQKIAGALFVIEGLGTIIVFNTYQDLFVMSIISLIPIIVGVLFLVIKPNKRR